MAMLVGGGYGIFVYTALGHSAEDIRGEKSRAKARQLQARRNATNSKAPVQTGHYEGEEPMATFFQGDI